MSPPLTGVPSTAAGAGAKTRPFPLADAEEGLGDEFADSFFFAAAGGAGADVEDFSATVVPTGCFVDAPPTFPPAAFAAATAVFPLDALPGVVGVALCIPSLGCLFPTTS